MTWRGTLRSVNAAIRRSEREQRRRQRELERQRKYLQKMEEIERAKFEVSEYENYIEVLQTVHKDVSDTWDWDEIRRSSPPKEPQKTNTREQKAKSNLANFKPGITDKLLRRTDKRIETLKLEIQNAIKEDEEIYQAKLADYKEKHVEWKKLREIAEKISGGDAGAYLTVIEEIDPFSEIRELGTSVDFSIESETIIRITLSVNSEEIVPREQKTQLKSGKLSVKKLPKSKFYEIYQDHVCSAVLRVSREVFALLPVETAIVTASTNMLNPSTGHKEETPIISVAVVRETLEGFNFDAIDPSESMNNFVHNAKFLKTKGFLPVEALTSKKFN